MSVFRFILTILLFFFHCDSNEAFLASNVVRCNYPFEQRYSESLKKCLSLVGGPCSPPSGESSGIVTKMKIHVDGKIVPVPSLDEFANFTGCVEGAECTKVGRQGYCECRFGFQTTSTRHCSLDYGKKGYDDVAVKCDETKLLGCIAGTCKCANNLHEYNAEKGSCVGLVGAFCTTNERRLLLQRNAHAHIKDHDGISHTHYARIYADCGDGAKCNPLANDQFGNGVCVCDTYHVDAPNRTCILSESQLSKETRQLLYVLMLVMIPVFLLAVKILVDQLFKLCGLPSPTCAACNY